MNSETQAVYDALAATRGKTLRESANFDSNRDKLIADLRLIVADADILIREAAGASSEEFSALKTRLEAKLADIRDKLSRVRAFAGNRAQQASAAAQAYARAKPWQAAGVLVATGAVVGFLLSRQTNGGVSDDRVE
jgi:ElaB/YqjD/DUF883 family membrane-anchored ribosome-binding protein